MSETLIFIPARSGSKRIKNKNIRKINGKPLLSWTIKYAKKYTKETMILLYQATQIISIKFLLRRKLNFLKDLKIFLEIKQKYILLLFMH